MAFSSRSGAARSEEDALVKAAQQELAAANTPSDLVRAFRWRQRLVRLLMNLIALEILGFYVSVAVKSMTVAEALELWGAFGPPTTGAPGLAASHYFQHGRQTNAKSR